MLSKFKYATEEDKVQILSDKVGRTLVEEEHSEEGDFLIVDDEVPAPVELITIPKTEYEDLQNQLLIAQGVI